MQDLAVNANDESPSLRKLVRAIGYAERRRSLRAWVAQDGVVELERFGEPFIHVFFVTACSEVGYVKLLQGLAILTE